ncbi:MAG TPA: thiamine phosphate synthase [Polyangia bacterium]|nr:thiamine phosphate synthase [Polyangia bacterium]
MTAPRLYLITDRHATAGRALVDVVRAALAAAPVDIAVQLREKDLDGRALTALAHELRVLTRAAGAALYINDRVDVALAVGADGVHLGGRALSPADVARVAPALDVAVSTHTRAEVEAAARFPNVRFAVFGPIWDTPSKRPYGPPVGLHALRAAATAGLPLLALGGVTPARVAEARAAGAIGVACIRAICSADDPGAALASLL